MPLELTVAVPYLGSLFLLSLLPLLLAVVCIYWIWHERPLKGAMFGILALGLRFAVSEYFPNRLSGGLAGLPDLISIASLIVAGIATLFAVGFFASKKLGF